MEGLFIDRVIPSYNCGLIIYNLLFSDSFRLQAQLQPGALGLKFSGSTVGGGGGWNQ